MEKVEGKKFDASALDAPDWVQRLVQEAMEMEARSAKLFRLVHAAQGGNPNVKVTGLPLDQESLLVIQYAAMQSYVAVLSARILKYEQDGPYDIKVNEIGPS